MTTLHRSLHILIVISVATVGLASAQTNKSNNFGANLGVLNYVVTTGTAHCTSNYGPVTYTYYDFSNFSFVSAQGVTQPISGYTYWDYGIGGRELTGNCPSSAYGKNITYNGAGYTIYLTPGHDSKGVGVLSSQIIVSGYVNPKYIVVGVIYAPPGSSSYVSYLNSQLVSSTVSSKSSYTTGYSEGSSVLTSQTLNPFKGGEIDQSSKSSSSYSQTTTTTDSTAVTVQKTFSNDLIVPGPLCDYCGVDHDYDQIGVWVNAVKLFTLTNNGVVQANGYGFSTYDQPGIDVYYVYAGELNGDIPMRSSTVTEFARAWAGANNGFQYAPGDGPALTAQDELNILMMDPYWNCTYKSAINDPFDCAEPAGSSFSGVVDTSGTAVTWVSGTAFSHLMDEGLITINGVNYTIAQVKSNASLTLTSSAGTQTGVAYSAPARFTQTTNMNFQYAQPQAGGGPDKNNPTWSYSTTSTQGTDISVTNQQTYGLENVFGVKLFGYGYQKTLTQQWTNSYTYETSSQFTTGSTSTSSAYLVGPVCNDVGGICSPQYPPAHAYNPIGCTALSLSTAFGQGDSMYIYQDNLFGTFLIDPHGQ